MLSKKIAQAAVILCVAALAACTTVEPPTTFATQVRESVQQAQSLGADQAAPLALREANQYLARAEEAMKRNEHEKAHQFLEKSMINSELAIARTNAQKSQKAARQVEESLEALKREATDPSKASSNTFE